MAETMGDRLLIRNIKVRSCCWCFFIECLPILLQISAGHFILNLVHAAAATAIHFTVQKYLPNELIIFILEMLDLPTAVTKRCVPACRAMVRVRVVTLWAVRSFLTSMNSNRMPHHMYTSIVACFNSACFCVCVYLCASVDWTGTQLCMCVLVHVCMCAPGSAEPWIQFHLKKKKKKKKTNEWEPRVFEILECVTSWAHLLVRSDVVVVIWNTITKLNCVEYNIHGYKRYRQLRDTRTDTDQPIVQQCGFNRLNDWIGGNVCVFWS